MNQQDIFRRPIQRKKPPKGARVLASILVPGRPSPQATIQEELIAETLARTGARSLEELIQRRKINETVAKQLRIQTIPRPTVEPPVRLHLIRQQLMQLEPIESLPASIQNTIRYIYRTITRIQRGITPMSLQAELKLRQNQLETLDRYTDELKALVKQFNIRLDHPVVSAALNNASEQRVKLLDRIITLQQHIREAAREQQTTTEGV